MEKFSKVRANDFQTQWAHIRETALSAMDRVGKSGWLILGNEVESFEKDLADTVGISNAVGCANGLDAIEIALRALGIQPGEKVITTPLSAFATTLAILRAGGVPIFVDVDDSGLVDLSQVSSVLEADRTIRFFVPVHLYGHALDLESLAALKKKFGTFVVEDCAQALGAKSAGAPVGTVAELAATSFYPTKNLGCLGDGGAVLSSSKEFAEVARTLRNYGQSQKYVHSILGLNSRLDEMQAAVLRTAILPKFSEWTLKRKQIAEVYLGAIRNPSIIIPATPKKSDSCWHLFPVLVEKKRASFLDHMASKGVEAGIHYPSLIPDQECMRNISNSRCLGSLARARVFANSEVSLPIHPFLSQDEVERVIAACNEWIP